MEPASGGSDRTIGLSEAHDPSCKIDLQRQRTRLMIQNALIELTAEKGFDAVTVQHISDRAMINRATFYRYHRDKFDLVEAMFGAAVDRMASGVVNPSTGESLAATAGELEAAWTEFLEHIAARATIYAAVLGGKASAWFQGRMRERFIELFRDRAPDGESSPDRQERIDLLSFMAASAIVGIIGSWIDTGTKKPKHLMAKWLSHVHLVHATAIESGLPSVRRGALPFVPTTDIPQRT